jgi:choice-of-anchor C domain-containing protein
MRSHLAECWHDYDPETKEPAMTRPVIVLALVLALAAALGEPSRSAPAPKERPNLLVNGSFEDGPEGLGNWQPRNPGDKAIKGWEVTRGQIDLVGNHWPAADGKRSLDLHGSPGLGGIKQTFPTKPGARYNVTFWMAGNPEGTVPKKRMGVSAAGSSKEFEFDATGKTVKAMGWVKKSWQFTATEKETTLEFYTLMKEDESCGPALDTVSVTADD